MEHLKKSVWSRGTAVLLAAFIVNFIIDGIRFAFGVFFVVFIDTFGRDAETTAWVGSLMFSVLNFSAPLCSVVVTNLGSRFSTVLGSLLCFLGFLTSALVPNLYFLYFSLGILTGVGLSLMYVAQTVIVVQHFKNNRAFAIGVSVCGSGIGGICFAFLMNVLTSEYAWNGIMLILSGTMLQAGVAGMLMRPKPRTAVGRSEETETLKTGKTNDDHADSVQKESVKSVYISLLKDPAMYLFTASQFFVFAAYMPIFIFIPIASKALGHSVEDCCLIYYEECVAIKQCGPCCMNIINKRLTAGLLTAISIANIISRLVTGALADRKFINRRHMFILALGITGCVCCLFAVCRQYVAIVVLCLLVGFGLGTIVTLVPVVITDLFGDKRISEVFGLSLFGRGPGNLTAPPLAGYIFDRTGSAGFVFIQCACSCFIGLIFMVLCERSRRKKSLYTQRSVMPE